MNFIVADSGSSKTDWSMVSGDGAVTKFRSGGLNPSYLDEEDIVASVCMDIDEGVRNTVVDKVFFYGAGCSGDHRVAKMQRALKKIFVKALDIEVYEDLFASARACLGKEPGLIAILGTGSNLDYYNGEFLAKTYPSPGYLIGDEGSGGHLGKVLIRSFLYRELEDGLMQDFTREFQMSPDEIIVKLYQSKSPNRYMATYSPFILKHISHIQMEQLVEECFREFFEKQVLKHPEYESVTLSFVGSIAYIYRPHLEKVAKEFNVKIGVILQVPMDELLRFHQQHG